jgi:hypothetical protein
MTKKCQLCATGYDQEDMVKASAGWQCAPGKGCQSESAPVTDAPPIPITNDYIEEAAPEKKKKAKAAKKDKKKKSKKK